MKKKIMGVIVALDDYSGFSQQNKFIFDELSLKFENVYINFTGFEKHEVNNCM